MPTITYQDGTVTNLPDPQGKSIQQISKRLIALTDDSDKMTELEWGVYIDDIIYLLLDYWKSETVEKPFDQLHRLVTEGQLSYRTDQYKDAFETRVKQNKELVTTFQTTDDTSYKEVLKNKLKSRGFIGVRKVETL